MSGFYLFISSKDSIKYHPDNKWDDFMVELTREYDLSIDTSRGLGLVSRAGWCMSLVDISLESDGLNHPLPQDIIVLSDLAMPSFYLGTEIGILRMVHTGSQSQSLSLHQPYYIGLSRPVFRSFRVCLVDKNLKPLKGDIFSEEEPAPAKHLKCTLHFQQM